MKHKHHLNIIFCKLVKLQRKSPLKFPISQSKIQLPFSDLQRPHVIQLLTTCPKSSLPFTPFSLLWPPSSSVDTSGLCTCYSSHQLCPQVVSKCHFLSVVFCSNLFKISTTYLSPACYPPSLLCYFLALIIDTDYITLSL